MITDILQSLQEILQILELTYSLTGIGTYGGFFDPVNSAGRIIKKEDLPTFNVTFEHRNFINGEEITFGNGWI